MLFVDLFFYTFLNQTVIILTTLIYLVYTFINSTSFFKYVLNASYILIWSAIILYYNQLELFATLLLLAEFVVMVYLFVLVIIGKPFFIKPVQSHIMYLFIFISFTTISYNQTQFTYIIINWYSLLLDSTDIYTIMSSFYEYNSLILVSIGILITLLTFIVGNIVILHYYSFLVFSINNITLKSQKKKRQVIKKPTIHIFKKSVKNDF